jgi:crotonobetainyl-CoA:carnitine CoA-transferase CaiB-like acyl-CoA transferase
LSHTLFPDRPPLMIYGHFAHYQGGAAAALGALAAYWARDVTGPQVIDVSIQDATVMVGAFAIQRLGDGSLEHRATRSFRYGGVFETRDGFIELLMLEDRQWHAFVEVMDSPSWATDAALSDPLERSRRGNAINEQVRSWMKARTSDDIVQRAQAAGVPAAAYRTPQQVLDGAHERSRRLFDRVSLPDGHQAQVMVAPFRFARSALTLGSGIPAIGQSSWPDATPASDRSNRAAIETTP